MGSRLRWFLCVPVALAAVLTAATLAYAVDQTPKNGCTSPQEYTGSITSPSFTSSLSPADEFGAMITFQGWFEVESVAPTGFDNMVAEYTTTPAQPDSWLPLQSGEFGGNLYEQAVPPTPGAADVPYSNNGTGVPPNWQSFTFFLPRSTNGLSNIQVRIRFATGDTTYQGFRGLGIDNIAISPTTPSVDETFENGSSWKLDPESGPGGPLWQRLQNPQNVFIKSPEINPRLVTLASGDNGALPALPLANGSSFAWFGNTASGTFCGPDFANSAVEPDTSITSAPPVSTASNDATFEFTSTQPGSSFFECQLDGGGFSFCGSPQTYTGLADGTHTFEVRATGLAGVDPTPATYTWTIRPATLADLDDPQLGVDVNVEEVAGTVLVGIPSNAARAAGTGRASQKGISFVPLSEASQIPVGSFLDTRRGTVRLESAQNASGKRQRGTFLNSLFQVRQSRKRSARGLTDLILKGASFRRCRTAGKGKGASAALSRRQIRRLRANARGRFRTSGRNSSATVRGTIWDITDRCDGTLTRVRRGKVVVRDFRRKKNVTLTTGKSYLAKAPG